MWRSLLLFSVLGTVLTAPFGYTETVVTNRPGILLDIFASNNQWYKVIDPQTNHLAVEPVTEPPKANIPLENLSTDVTFCHSPIYGDAIGWLALKPRIAIGGAYSKDDLIGSYIMFRKNGIWQPPIKTPYSGIKSIAFGKDGKLHIVWLDHSIRRIEGIDLVVYGKMMYGIYDGMKFSKSVEIAKGRLIDPQTKEIFLKATDKGDLILFFNRDIIDKKYYIVIKKEGSNWRAPVKLFKTANDHTREQALMELPDILDCNSFIQQNQLFLAVNFLDGGSSPPKPIQVFRVDWEEEIKLTKVATITGDIESPRLFGIRDQIGLIYTYIFRKNDYVRAILIRDPNRVLTLYIGGPQNRANAHAMIYTTDNQIGVGFNRHFDHFVQIYGVDEFYEKLTANEGNSL